MVKAQVSKPLSAAARTGLAILAAAVLAVLALAYLLLAWQQAAEDRHVQALAEHDMVMARAAKAVREGAARLTASDQVEQMFLAGDTPGLAIANFQNIAGDAASESGLSVVRMTPVDVGDAGDGKPFRLSIDADGSLAQLEAFLVAIERALPVMIVSRLELQPAAAEGTADPFPSEALRISVAVDAEGTGAKP